MIPNLLAGKCSVSDNQFGSIRRPVVDEAMAVWEKEKWSERPDSIYPFLSYVHLGNREGLAVLTNSVREYEIVGKDFRTIAITVFRSVGVLGKEKLSRRPGRPSGIKMETPDSQMIGKYSFEFAVTADCMHAPQRAKEYVTPLVTYNKMPYNAMKLNVPQIRTPYCYSLLKLDNPLITMSVLKKEENGDHLLLRCYNGTGETQRGILETDYENAGEVMLDETHLSAGNGSKELTVEKNQIKTVLLKRNAG